MPRIRFFFALCTLTACAPDDQEEIAGLVGDYAAEINDQTAVECDCWQELGHGSQSDCEDRQILPAKRRCLEDAFGREPDNAKERLQCIIPLEAEYTECVDDRLVCDALSEASACVDDYNLGIESCPEFSASVKRAYDECVD
jgi:hypothetical protein